MSSIISFFIFLQTCLLFCRLVCSFVLQTYLFFCFCRLVYSFFLQTCLILMIFGHVISQSNANWECLELFFMEILFHFINFQKVDEKKQSPQKFTCNVIVQILVLKSGLYIITGKGYYTQKCKDFLKVSVRMVTIT